MVETPIIGATQDAHIEAYQSLREALMVGGHDVKLVADEWCNTVADIKRFVDCGQQTTCEIGADAGGPAVSERVDGVVESADKPGLFMKRTDVRLPFEWTRTFLGPRPAAVLRTPRFSPGESFTADFLLLPIHRVLPAIRNSTVNPKAFATIPPVHE